MSSSESMHGMWSSRLMFILAAAGSAVGLGNIWRFPYVAGENGGGAFVLVYLVCIFLIGIPILMSEVLLGREGRQSPINTMQVLVERSSAHKLWNVIGWMGAAAGFMILSFYAVIAGWAMSYVKSLADGTFVAATAEVANNEFNSFVGDPYQVVMWHGIFMVLTIFIVGRGVSEGLEKAVKYLMPALFFLLLVLVGYSATTSHFGEGLEFLFSFNVDKLDGNSVLIAMGQAFFTLSLGMGAIMTYGAYMPRNASIAGSATIIALLDTAVALLAGMAVFPLVFANGLESSSGPGLMFVTLPLAFGQMSGGVIFGTLFFLLVTFAAITSAISLMEPALSWLIEHLRVSRVRGAILVGGVAWILGLGSAFSTNIWSELYILPQMTIFDTFDYVSNNIMLPVGGMLIALFAGWVVDQKVCEEQLQLSPGQFTIWQTLVRFVAPAAVGVVFFVTLFG